jgi:hypothetical protein
MKYKDHGSEKDSNTKEATDVPRDPSGSLGSNSRVKQRK